jgi:uncharacterized protein YjbI with pentapeptide repeats
MNRKNTNRTKANFGTLQLCRGAAVTALSIFLFHSTTAFSLAQEMVAADRNAWFSSHASVLSDLPDNVYCSPGSDGDALQIEFNGCDAAAVHKGIALLRHLRVPFSIGFAGSVPLDSEDCDGLAELESLTEISFEGAVLSEADLTRLFSNWKGYALVALALPPKMSFDNSHAAPILPSTLHGLALNGSSLPADTWKSLASANMRYLSATGGPLSEEAWRSISQMKQLRRLALEIHPEDEAASKHLAALPALEELCIDGGALDYNSAMDMSWSLLKCKHLCLYNISLDRGVIDVLSSLSALRGLRLEGCNLHSSNVSALHKLDGLQGLSFAGSNISPEGAMRLPALGHLELLDLSATKIDDQTIATLSAMESLKLLKLGHTAVSDSMMDDIAAIPNLTVLDLPSTLISDAGVSALQNCQHLEQLSLRQTHVTPKSLAVLATLPALRAFGLTGVSMKGANFKDFKNNTRIEGLHLQGCDINDDILAEILEIPGLKSLDVSHNPEVTTLSAERILNHPSLEKISVEGCGINEKDLRRMKAHFQIFETDTVEFVVKLK